MALLGKEPAVALVGIHGYGRWHARNLARLARAGAIRFVAAADPRHGDRGGVDLAVALYPDLDALLSRHQVDVVVISTPIHTHVPLAEVALRAGADVLLEKPPAATLADFEHLLGVVGETGRACQVGFQTFGSAAVRALREMIAAGTLGEIRGIGGA